MNNTENLKSRKTAVSKDISPLNDSDKLVKMFEYFVESLLENYSLNKSLNVLLEKISRIFSWNFSRVWLTEPVTGELKQTALYNENPDNPIFEDINAEKVFKEIKETSGVKFLDKPGKFLKNKNSKLRENLTLISIPLIAEEDKSAFLIAGSKDRASLESIPKIGYEHIARLLASVIKEKLNKDKLIKNDILLEHAQKIARIVSWELDISNDLFRFSDEFYDLFEIELNKNIEHKDFYKYIQEYDKHRIEEALKNAAKSGKLVNLEISGITGTGKPLELILKAEPEKNISGSVDKLIGTIQDITRLKETERVLRHSEEYFRSMIENSLDIKTIISIDGKILYVSPSIEKILGYLPEEMIEEPIVKFIHPDDILNIKSVFDDIIRMPGFTTSVEFRIRHKKGSWCILQSLLKNMLNSPVVSGIIVSSRDISSKKEAENSIKSLLAISEKLNSTLDVDVIMDILISEAINLVGAEGGCTGLRTTEGLTCKKYFNGGASETFEYSWPPGVGLPGWLIENKQPYISNDALLDPVVLKELVDRFNIKSVACIPIMDMKNEVIGFLEVKNKLNHAEFSETDKERLISLAQIASITIQNALAYQKIQMAEFQIKISREQLRRLSAHLQSAREEERTRIAREIHDELGQALTGLKMDISWLHKKMQNLGIDNPQLFEKTSGMSSLVDSTIKTVRKISSELRPGVLDYLGLPAAIEWQTQDFQNRTGITCNIISLPKDLQLDQNKSTAIFRIFQETLTNIARHSQATEVGIELKREGEKLNLTIKDNGRGVTESELINTKSFGVLGMRERTLLLGGDFTIRGEQNKGTTVSVEIPIAESDEGGGTL